MSVSQLISLEFINHTTSLNELSYDKDFSLYLGSWCRGGQEVETWVRKAMTCNKIQKIQKSWTKDTATEMSWDVNFLIIRLITSPPLMFMSEQETQNVLLLLTTWLVGQFLHPRHHREQQKNWKTGIINNLSTTCLLCLQSRPVAWMLWSASHQQG